MNVVLINSPFHVNFCDNNRKEINLMIECEEGCGKESNILFINVSFIVFTVPFPEENSLSKEKFRTEMMISFSTVKTASVVRS